MTTQALTMTRSVSMALAGVVCAAYAVLVLISGQPDPMPFWIPGGAGFLAMLVIWFVASTSGRKAVEAGFDEGYIADAVLAQRIGFWVAIWLYPVFAVPLSLGWIGWPSAFAAMGTLTAATYLLGSVILDLRGRG